MACVPGARTLCCVLVFSITDACNAQNRAALVQEDAWTAWRKYPQQKHRRDGQHYKRKECTFCNRHIIGDLPPRCSGARRGVGSWKLLAWHRGENISAEDRGSKSEPGALRFLLTPSPGHPLPCSVLLEFGRGNLDAFAAACHYPLAPHQGLRPGPCLSSCALCVLCGHKCLFSSPLRQRED